MQLFLSQWVDNRVKQQLAQESLELTRLQIQALGLRQQIADTDNTNEKRLIELRSEFNTLQQERKQMVIKLREANRVVNHHLKSEKYKHQAREALALRNRLTEDYRTLVKHQDKIGIDVIDLDMILSEEELYRSLQDRTDAENLALLKKLQYQAWAGRRTPNERT